MKKFWKALGITALAAAVIPYRIRKDREEDVTTVDALLWQLTRRPGEGEEKNQVDITLGFKSPLQEVREERELFTEDPDETVLFADMGDDAEADASASAEAEEASPTEETADPVVTEEDFDPDSN